MPDDSVDDPKIEIPLDATVMAQRFLIVALASELVRSGALKEEAIIGRLGALVSFSQEILGPDVAAEFSLVREMLKEALEPPGTEQ